MRSLFFIIGLFFCYGHQLSAQPDTIVIGFGGYESVTVSTGHDEEPGSGQSTLKSDGYLPNEAAASRFLSQAALGYSIEDIETVVSTGREDWIDAQMALPMTTTLLDEAEAYRQFVLAETSDNRTTNRYWRYAWWQYHMTNSDLLRQRVALALSEILVISEQSTFRGNGHAISDYYDILLINAFGNYKDLLEQVTVHPTMGVYLTSLNNAKTNVEQNRYPDENYAREIMQLFSIGTTMLNMDGTEILDSDGIPVPSYTNDDIVEFAKIFTGYTWYDRTNFGRGALSYESYLQPMVMWNDFHEPGEKYLLNGFVVPDRNPVDGLADVADAIDNVFSHQNVPPFVSKFLIQRLVTANPSPEYVTRVASVFADNGDGVRGDLSAVVKAILLDPEATACESATGAYTGSLKEPFVRYMQIQRAFHVSTISGNFRNDMRVIFDETGQRPLSAETVFSFFQRDYQPIGAIEDASLVAPVFQITDGQTISGYINGLYRWLLEGNVADEADLYGGEENDNYADEISVMDLSTEITEAGDETLPILLDKLNLVLAAGQMSDYSIGVIRRVIEQFPQEDEEDLDRRVKLAIYLIMSSPEYLINR